MTLRELEDQLMGLRIRETDAVAELKEMRQKVMELETQVNVLTASFSPLWPLLRSFVIKGNVLNENAFRTTYARTS